MVLECFEPHLKSKMRKIIDIVFLILYLQTGWLSIYAVDYISSDYHCIIFHKKLCNCIFFPITWNATDVNSYPILVAYLLFSVWNWKNDYISKVLRKCSNQNNLFLFLLLDIFQMITSQVFLRLLFYVMFQSAWYLKK